MELYCPKCQEILVKNGSSYICKNRHTYDIAREGYLNLNIHGKNSGDDEDLVNARRRFLEKGHYAFLKEEVCRILKEEDITSLCDFACGEGYYTKDFPARDKTGIDLSKKTLKLASKRDKDTFYLLTSIFHTPFKEGSFDCVTTLFAPLASNEAHRILKEGGLLLYVHPGERHLYELKKALYEDVYENKTDKYHPEGFSPEKNVRIEKTVRMVKEDIRDLFAMTPYAKNTRPEDIRNLDTSDEMDITLSFLIDCFRKERSPL